MTSFGSKTMKSTTYGRSGVIVETLLPLAVDRASESRTCAPRRSCSFGASWRDRLFPCPLTPSPWPPPTRGAGGKVVQSFSNGLSGSSARQIASSLNSLEYLVYFLSLIEHSYGTIVAPFRVSVKLGEIQISVFRFLLTLSPCGRGRRVRGVPRRQP